MAGPSRALGFLIGVALLAFAGTASADNDHKAPEVAGTTATDITSSGATLRGTVNPNKRSTTYRFQYGRTQAYGSLTSQASAGDGEAALPVSAVLSGLTPSTTYHYRLVATNDKGTTLGQSKTFTTLAASSPSDPGSSPSPGGTTEGGETAPGPQLGKSFLVAPGAGQLLVRKPGTTDFEPLELGSALPMGTEVDASAGSLALTSALPGGATQTGHFGGGRFLIRQGNRGYLDLYLRGRYCSSARASTAGVASAAAKSKRRLWGRDRGGRFRTHGKNSHATVRGTRWVVSDSCQGTLTRVTNGSVVVTDKVRHKLVLLEAGERYLARPRR